MKKPRKRKNSVVMLKHKMVIDNMQKMVRKGMKPNKTKAMIEAGYSESYAKSSAIKKKKTWNELMEEYLPDDLLVEKHQLLLMSKEMDYFVFPKNMSYEEIDSRMAEAGIKLVVVRPSDKGQMAFYSRPNTRAIQGGIDLAYKIKAKNSPEKFEVEQTGLRALSDSELAEVIRKAKARFNKTD